VPGKLPLAWENQRRGIGQRKTRGRRREEASSSKMHGLRQGRAVHQTQDASS